MDKRCLLLFFCFLPFVGSIIGSDLPITGIVALLQDLDVFGLNVGAE